MALLLTRKLEEVVEIHTSDGIIRVWGMTERANSSRVVLAIDAPKHIQIVREEIKRRKV